MTVPVRTRWNSRKPEESGRPSDLRMKKEMDKKTVMVTGATSGIGRSCALRFAKEGCRMILNGRNGEKLLSLEKEISGMGCEVVCLPFDVRELWKAKEAFDALPDDWKKVDVLVNNAGLALDLSPIDKGNPEDWDIMIDTNVKGLLYMLRIVLPVMKENGKGHVINIGSVAGEAAYAGGSVYCSTKAAVKTISDGLRIELADTPIRVTNIKPGLVETNFSVTRFKGDKDRADGVYKGIKPLTGDDIAECVYFAASAPEHVQIAEMLVLATHQANGSYIYRQQ